MLTMRDGVCEQARLTIVGMGEGPFRARAAEEALTGRRIGPKDSREVFAEAAAKVDRRGRSGRRRPCLVIVPPASGRRDGGAGLGNGAGADGRIVSWRENNASR